MTDSARRNCWISLSDLFVDNVLDFQGVAVQMVRHCQPMSDEDIRRAFFYEVAPVLGPQTLSPAPLVWTEFDSDEVIKDVTARIQRRALSPLFHIQCLIGDFACRLWFAFIWKELAKAIAEERSSSHTGDMNAP
ncbi:hypothetical protein [Pandoraea sp. NPDC090278]|uniref:DUF7079 family protein n=1 Tax=Pandoraea sp. NPDC090278 TaxID=3364391 RepID=UPI00383A8412